MWQVLAWALGNSILLAGPLETIQAFARGVVTVSFWGALGFSFARIAGGFTIAFAFALLCGALSWKNELFREFLHPVVTFMKSVPVVCIIVLLLVWTGAANVSIIAVALMVFPPVYFSFLEGLQQTDDSMREMLTVFDVQRLWRIRYYYIPAVMPYLISASKVVVGIAWKSGVAAEVIGIPNGSIGAGIYSAKIGLSTADLFAWTFAIVALSALCEKFFLKLLSVIKSKGSSIPRSKKSQGTHVYAAEPVRFDKIGISFDDKTVIENYSQLFKAGGRYCIMAPSGSGKSTLMNLISGLVRPDTGRAEIPERVSVCFQEDRLLEQLSAWGNVALVCPNISAGDRKLLKFDLDETLGRDSAALQIEACSGGMKRKIALMRALAGSGSVLLLDEPFAGLDDISKTDVVALINRHLHGRTLIVATHDSNDVTFLNAELIRLPTR